MVELRVYALTVINSIPEWFYWGLLVLVVVGGVVIYVNDNLNPNLNPNDNDNLNGIVRWKRDVARLMLVAWVALVIASTVVFRESRAERRIQLEPLRSYWDFGEHSYFMEYFAVNVLNVALFVPIGLLLGFMVKGSRFTVRKGWMVALMVGMLISVAIETLQFIFRKGYAEVDDVIHNTLGCLVGYSLWFMVHGAWLKVHG